jgi:hypothetical protein
MALDAAPRRSIRPQPGPGDKRQYPAPMVLLSTLFGRRANPTQAYEQVVVPFLNRMVTQFPVDGYPANPPTPPLSDLLKDWSIVVRFGDRFQRVYRRADSNKTVLFEFQGVRTTGRPRPCDFHVAVNLGP